MARRVVRLTPDHLSTLPQEVATRLRWKVDAVTLARTPADARAAEVQLWVSEVLRDWGSCGRVVLWDDEPVGVAVHAPPAFLPGLGELPTAPPSPDAVVLADLFVAPHARNAGVGRMLVQAVARDLVGREVRALEAFGSTSARAEEEGMLPADFLGAVGFHTHRPHVTTPRMRIDMRSTRTWRSEVEQALGKLVGVVRPRKSPVPTPMQSDEKRPRGHTPGNA
jgi:GNAT superfamily N-acetyltransferase